jgi:hypothetical protein
MHSKGTVNHCGGLDKEADTKPQPSPKTGPVARVQKSDLIVPTRRELLEVTVSEYRNIGMCILAEETIQTLVFIRAKRHFVSATDMQRSPAANPAASRRCSIACAASEDPRSWVVFMARASC